MTKDKEIEALAVVSSALSNLDADAATRVLQWAANRFGVALPPKPAPGATTPGTEDEEPGGFADVNELFGAASPSTNPHKALVVAYWFQEVEGQPDFGSQKINSQLKNMGHPVGNITRALQGLIDRKPALVMQVRKKGTAKQARKRYKLTAAGRHHVDEMIRAHGE